MASGQDLFVMRSGVSDATVSPSGAFHAPSSPLLLHQPPRPRNDLLGAKNNEVHSQDKPTAECKLAVGFAML